jgi:hypothetical protein
MSTTRTRAACYDATVTLPDRQALLAEIRAVAAADPDVRLMLLFGSPSWRPTVPGTVVCATPGSLGSRGKVSAMVDKDLLSAKLADLANRIDRVRAQGPIDPTRLAADRDALDIVSFNLMLCV